MISACPDSFVAPSSAGRLAAFIECQASNLGAAPFHDHSGAAYFPGLIAAAITLFVATQGYRLLLGERFTAEDAVRLALRLGIVLALATSWAAYQPLIYRVVLDGPAEISASLLGTGPTNSEDAVVRLAEQIQAVLDESHLSGSSTRAPTGALSPVTSVLADQHVGSAALGFPGAIVIYSSLGGLLALRLLAGFLLGVGPLFLFTGLFDVSLGVAVGWVRTLLGVVAASAALLVNSTIEIAFLRLEIQHFAGGPGASATGSISDSLVTAGVIFSVTALLSLVGCFVLATALKAPPRQNHRRSTSPGLQSASPISPAGLTSSTLRSFEPVSRAAQVADAVATQMRRDRNLALAGTRSSPAAAMADSSSVANGRLDYGPENAIASQRRPVGSRLSPGATRRDEAR